VALALRRARVPTVLLHDLGDVHLELEHVSARVSRPVLWSNLMDALCKVLTGESAEALTADLPAVVAGTRVLLVEDNPDNQRVAVKALERHGAVVEVAGDGEGAVRAAGRGWDLILMDVDLPGIDGVEATRRIRAAGLEAVPIVAFTAHATVALRQRCLQAGMTDFLAKPAPSQALLELLARHVQRSHAVLVVDDAADSRMLLRRFLQGEPDVAVHEAASAQEALEQLGRLPFALVLMDLDLGGVGGEEALETLRTQGYTMPVLAVTGHDDPAVKARCLAAGFSGFVLKPVRRPAFLAQVRAVLAPPSGLTPAASAGAVGPGRRRPPARLPRPPARRRRAPGDPPGRRRPGRGAAHGPPAQGLRRVLRGPGALRAGRGPGGRRGGPGTWSGRVEPGPRWRACWCRWGRGPARVGGVWPPDPAGRPGRRPGTPPSPAP
jgi:CheY-like chemotaxis protein